MRENSKYKEIAELIRLITQDQLEPNISMFVQYAIDPDHPEETKSLINQRLKDQIDQLIAPFNEIFNQDEIILLISFFNEIKRLVSFYQSEAMKKFFKNKRQLFNPLYDFYFQMIEEMGIKDDFVKATGTLE